MKALTLERGLTDTGPNLGTLQRGLVDQFKTLHEQERTKAFLGREMPEDMMSGDLALLDRYEEVEPPLLTFVSSDLQQTAVALQSWEGVVISVQGETFVARLTDKSASSPEEEVEMSFRDVSDDDKDLIQLGAIFYWSIGYETTASGQIKRTSVIKFRRLPAWTARELSAVKQKASDVRKAIGWGKQDAASKAG